MPPWMQSKKVCEVDSRPVHGASMGSNWDNTRGRSLSASKHDCWSARPRMQSRLGWTEDAPEVRANEWTSESSSNTSWDFWNRKPPRVQLLPRRAEQGPKDQEKEDHWKNVEVRSQEEEDEDHWENVEVRSQEEQDEDHWENVEMRSQEEEGAAATAALLQHESSIWQEGSSSETSV